MTDALDGSQVAMVHRIMVRRSWMPGVGMFVSFAKLAGMDVEAARFTNCSPYRHALEGEADGGGLLAYNLLSGEPVVGVEARPLLFRTAESRFTLATMYAHAVDGGVCAGACGDGYFAGEGRGGD